MLNYKKLVILFLFASIHQVVIHNFFLRIQDGYIHQLMHWLYFACLVSILLKKSGIMSYNMFQVNQGGYNSAAVYIGLATLALVGLGCWIYLLRMPFSTSDLLNTFAYYMTMKFMLFISFDIAENT